MILKLNYTNKIQHEIRAVYIRSSKPAVWLEQMTEWDINPLNLTCFAVPISKKTIEIAGLFVIFPLGNVPKTIGQTLAYGAITPQFFIPIQANLFPQISSDELKNILLFDYQVFHPSIGMIGFQEADKVQLEELLILPERTDEQWNIAKSAPLSFPPLRHIQIPKLLDDDFLNHLKDGIKTKSLEDIPGAKKGKSKETWFEKIQRKALEKMLEENKKSGNQGGGMAGTGGFGGLSALDGLFGAIGEAGSSFQTWARRRLEDLEQKRQDEINRLMDLFEKNPEEALKYALPLDGNYLGRGDAPPSSSLGRRNTNFSLGGLGGGGRVDGWNLGNRYFELRKKYEAEAQRLLRLNNYRKAAYIYAHLLSDFSAAANVLVQGKYYREAAVLYQKHLNNKPAAADCLEKGGLLLEAIDLYIDLGKHVKVGDLYRSLEQLDKARLFYKKGITAAFENDDYLRVSFIQGHRLLDSELADSTLLEGWQKSKQFEACLDAYFDKRNGIEIENIQRAIEHVYTQYTPAHRKDSFLKALLRLSHMQRDEEILEASRPIAYEIISEQVTKDNVGNVHHLRQFLPNDRLIGSDCSRYITQFHTKKKQETKVQKTEKEISIFQLDRKVNWQHFTTRLDQILAIGTTKNALHLARGNSEGHWNYYSWTLDMPNLEDIRFRLFTNLEANSVFVQSSVPIYLSMKKLAKSVRFMDDLWMRGTHKLPAKIVGLEMEGSDSLVAITLNQTSFKLNFYDPNLNLLVSYSSLLDIEQSFYSGEGTHAHSNSSNLVIDGHYFTICGDHLYRLATASLEERKRPLHANATMICGTEGTLLVSTDKGFLLLEVGPRELRNISDFFAKELSVSDMIFLDYKTFVIVGKYLISIYEVSAAPKVIKTIHTQKKIVKIALYRERMTLAVLMEGGEIRVYKVE